MDDPGQPRGMHLSSLSNTGNWQRFFHAHISMRTGWAACSNFSSASVGGGFLGTELIAGKLDAQRQLWNPPVSFPQFPILMLVTWRQDKNKLWVPEREGNSWGWAEVQAGRVILRYLARGGRGHPSVVPKQWSPDQQQPSPENVEPQKFRVSEERPGPGELPF